MVANKSKSSLWGALIMLAFGVVFVIILIITPLAQWQKIVFIYWAIELDSKLVFVVAAAAFLALGFIFLAIYFKFQRNKKSI